MTNWNQRIATDLGKSKAAQGLVQPITGLLSRDDETRVMSLDALYAAVYRDGNSSVALTKAAPLLLELALRGVTPSAGLVLVFLRTLVAASPRNARDGFHHESVAADASTPVERAIADQAGALVPLMAEGDPVTRGAAASLFALLCGVGVKANGKPACDMLLARLGSETDANARASVAMASGLVAARLESAAFEGPLSAAVADETTLVRVAAACGAIRARRVEPAMLSADSMGALRTALDPVSVDEFPWANGDPVLLAAEALTFLAADGPKALVSEAIAVLCELVRARAPFADRGRAAVTAADVMLARAMGQPIPTVTPEPSAVDRAKSLSLRPLTTCLLEIAFGAKPRKRRLTRKQLSDEQLKLLRFLAYECEIDTVYPQFGLPLRPDMAPLIGAP